MKANKFYWASIPLSLFVCLLIFYLYKGFYYYSPATSAETKRENVRKYYSNSVYSFITVKEKYPRAKITKITHLENLFIYCSTGATNPTNKVRLHLVLNNTNLIVDKSL